MDLSAIFSNEVFSGIAGGSLLMSGLYTLRGLPEHLTKLAKWQFTSRAVVHSDDSAFDMVEDWLSSHDSVKAARRMKVISRYSEHEQRNAMQIAHGFGTHLLWFGARPLLVTRDDDSKNMGGSLRRRESITLVTPGRSPATLRRVVQEIVDSRSGGASDFVEVFLFRDYWRLASRKTKRALDSVVLPREQRSRIVADLEQFTESRDWYQRMGIPYRRGLLLSGPPGCGKSSLALALAGHLGRRIYALNLGSVAGDEQLIEAVSLVPEDSVLLIEDVDAAQAKRVASVGEEEKKPITMSGLLNCLDGVFARDGRILIMTTNHADRIDPALLRPGRADRIEEIGPLGRSEAWSMAARFGQHDYGNRVGVPITAATLQQQLIARVSERGIAEAAE